MEKISIIGAGNMGAAIAKGLLNKGNIKPRIVDSNEKRLIDLRDQGLICSTFLESISADELVVLAIPPQAFSAFAANAKLLRGHQAPIVSIMAGIRMAEISKLLDVPHVVRSIPNTPSEVYAGMTVFCASPMMTGASVNKVISVFETFGKCVRVDDESLIDPATALCGGGPAFTAFFADAMQKFAIGSGFNGKDAAIIAQQVLRGTADLIEASEKPPMQICREVMTPHGTTERGIRHFEENRLREIVIGALNQSARRSREIGRIQSTHTTEAPR